MKTPVISTTDERGNSLMETQYSIGISIFSILNTIGIALKEMTPMIITTINY